MPSHRRRGIAGKRGLPDDFVVPSRLPGYLRRSSRYGGRGYDDYDEGEMDYSDSRSKSDSSSASRKSLVLDIFSKGDWCFMRIEDIMGW